MPERYQQAIIKYLAGRDEGPLKPRQIARQMGVAEQEYGAFREAIKQLRDEGRIVLGAKNAIMLPEMGNKVTGYYRHNRKGFGFIIPESPNAHGDLFVPKGNNNGAMTGDRVVATVRRKGKRDGKVIYDGQIVEVLDRAENRFVGTLEKAEGVHFVIPEGRKFTQPILLRDVGSAGPGLGTKVVVEITEYGQGNELPAGVIVETLGPGGQIEVETRAVIRAHGLREEFPEEVLQQARDEVANYDPAALDHDREDLSDLTIITIDPDDARDYDDAISLERDDEGNWLLGVHIADVAHFVRPGTPLDDEAYWRATSTYFPRRVLPMLPEVLSNGVCSLQQGQPRLAKSCYIRYDPEGHVLETRLAESVITSAKRLTYLEAQAICDGKTGDHDGQVVNLVQNMKHLAGKIEARREEAGMLHLDLPEVELILDDKGKVVDAAPEDDSYTHTIIEMFMVEANEAVARALHRRGRHFLRRIHPDPEAEDRRDLTAFVKACGQNLPAGMSRKDLQALLDSVKGRPESYAVNLAVLKTFQQAEYSPMQVGHFALASDCYCHFTSPIRRYPDLTVHRLVSLLCRGELDSEPLEAMDEMVELGAHCSTASRRAEAAENELREVLVLQLMKSRQGEAFSGIITGVANFGIFVQWPKFLVEGLIRLEDLGDDWWEVTPKLGRVRGEHTGRTYRLGDEIEVQVTGVDVARRQLNLLPVSKNSRRQKKSKGGSQKSRGSKQSGGGGKQSGGGDKKSKGSKQSGGGSKKSKGSKQSNGGSQKSKDSKQSKGGYKKSGGGSKKSKGGYKKGGSNKGSRGKKK